MVIRLQADPKAIGHYLPRPAAAISAKAWTKVFNDGMDQRCVRFEIPSSELENWRSTNSFLRPSKEAVERIFDEWIEVWYLLCRAGGGTRGKHGKSAEARPKCKLRISRSWSFGRKVGKGLIINEFFFLCLIFYQSVGSFTRGLGYEKSQSWEWAYCVEVERWLFLAEKIFKIFFFEGRGDQT